jgi:myo-inositol 2-dehydrogenase / D-chiro-inositol 1-dehydrogenase
MIRVGIIGLGKMGRLHFLNSQFHPGVKVTAVTDISPRNLDWATHKNPVNTYPDYEAMIRSEPLDAVVIALPHFLHKPCSQYAAENDLHIFLEKPIANNFNDGKEIIDTVRKHGVQFTVGCNCRFIDSVVKLKKEYDDGLLGDIEISTLDNIGNGPFSPFLEPTPIPDWYFDPQAVGGGALLDLGFHMIDLFNWFFHDPQLEYARFDNRYDLPYEDSVILVLRSKKTNTKGIVNLGWFSRSIFPKFNFRVTLHGTVDYDSTDRFLPNLYGNAVTECLKNISRKVIRKPIQPLSYTYYYHSYYKEIENFYDAIIHGSKPLVTPEDSLKTMEIIQNSYDSCHSGKKAVQ